MDTANRLNARVRPGAASLAWTDFVSTSAASTLLAEACQLVNCSGGGSTHWLSLDDQPECALEALVMSIGWFHRNRLGEAAGATSEKCGVEWWVQVREPDESLAIHWDCGKSPWDIRTPTHSAPRLAM